MRVLERLQRSLDETARDAATDAAAALSRRPGSCSARAVELGEDVRFGAHVVVHPGTVIGDGVRVEDGAVLGKGPRLGPASHGRRAAPAPLEIGRGAAVCAGAVVYAGATIGAGAVVGDQAQVRERAVSAPGRWSGAGAASTTTSRSASASASRRWSTSLPEAWSRTTSSSAPAPPRPTTMRWAATRAARRCVGAPLRRACRVGGGAVLVPGVEVGEEAFVAAGAVVAADVPPRAVVMGVPARVVREVGDEDLLERWR